jgi:hypothetical protein
MLLLKIMESAQQGGGVGAKATCFFGTLSPNFSGADPVRMQSFDIILDNNCAHCAEGQSARSASTEHLPPTVMSLQP